jgi:hypothetical protein
MVCIQVDRILFGICMIGIQKGYFGRSGINEINYVQMAGKGRFLKNRG